MPNNKGALISEVCLIAREYGMLCIVWLVRGCFSKMLMMMSLVV